jgi:hypothetical protein
MLGIAGCAAASPAAAKDGIVGQALEPRGAGPLSSSGTTEEPTSALPDGATDPVATGKGKITIHADRARISFGQRVTFTGRRQPARKGETVKLKYKRPGGDFETVETTRTDADGRYEVSTKPKRNGVFVVTSPRRSGKQLRSGREEVEVRAGLELGARKHQLKVKGVKVKGRLRPRGEDRRVVIQRETAKGGWSRVAAAKTDAAGEFRAVWDTADLGGYMLRARFRGDESNLGSSEELPARLYVYRADEASYYGPGFYGNQTACGQTLRRETVGVAHKKIRCGAKVRFHYRGRTRKVKVIDRGPFIRGRRWDLTDAARKELGFPRGVDEVWANR